MGGGALLRRGCGALLLGAVGLLAPWPARAQIAPEAFGPAAGDDIVSVGDPLTVVLAAQLGGLLPQLDVTYTYLVSPSARYVPNSVTIGGVSAADSDNRIEVGDGYVRVSLGSAGPGPLAVSLRLRAVGSIGEVIEHRATLSALLVATQSLRGPVTHIEDERAWLLPANALADSRIHAGQPTWNYGGASQVVLSNQAGAEQRGVLRFDLSGVTLASNQIVAGRVELWPSYTAEGPAAIALHRLRVNWAEGTQAGATCTGGVTWRAPNCSDTWTPGGDYESGAKGSTTVLSQAGFAAIDITSLVADWVSGARPNQGVVAIASDLPAGSALSFASREGASPAAPGPRLSVIAAPAGAYAQKGVKDAKAEILPIQVYGSLSSQRFVYSALPNFDAGSTGVNRLRVTLGVGFSLVQVDSVFAHGLWLRPNDDETLSDAEYEVWTSPGAFDVRVAPTITRTSLSRLVQVVFRARTPTVAVPTTLPFPAAVDHDRLGYPPQNASPGDANASAADGDTWSVTVVPTDVVGLTVAPADTSVAQGVAVAYRAWATFADGGRAEVSDQVIWSIGPQSLGWFESSGTLHTLQQGSGVVLARLGLITTAPASVTINAPVLQQLYVEPGAARAPVGVQRSFAARGIYSSGDTLDVTLPATWALSDTSVARMLAPGEVQAVRPGATKVTASLAGITGAAATLDVSPAELLALTVTPADTTVALGWTAALRAYGTYTDGHVAELTGVVTWASTPPGIIDVGADGVATTLAVGSAWVTANLDAIDSPAVGFQVGPAVLIALDGTPDAAVVPAGVVHQVRSSGTYSDGTSKDLTLQVSWQSLDTGVATFLAPGSVYAAGPGTARLVHALAEVRGDTLTLQVTPALLDSVTVAPELAVLPPGVALPLMSTAHFSDGTAVGVTHLSNWDSDAPAIATVDTSGVVSTLAEGAARITATFGGQPSPPSVIQVTTTALDTLAIAPADTTLPRGLAAPCTAWGRANGVAYDLTSSVTWSSADTTVATVGPLGVVHARAEGSTSIEARLGLSSTATATLTVAPPSVMSVEVTPAAASVLLWRTKALQATARMSDGRSVDVTALAAWESDAPSVVYADPTGVAVALSLGTARVRATWQSRTSLPAGIVVLPSVRAEALTVGAVPANPGSHDRLLLTVRLDNAYLQPRDLTALGVSLSAPPVVGGANGAAPEPLPVAPRDDVFAALRLHSDDGDGVFEPASDPVLATGVPSSGAWTASSLALSLPVGGARTLFVSGDVSLVNAVHLDTLDARVAASAQIFFGTTTAVVAPSSFPLNSAGQVVVKDLVSAQIAFTEAAPDTAHPGDSGVPLLEFTCPDDGRQGDVLQELRVRQIGSARAGTDLTALRLQLLSGGSWSAVTDALGAPAQLVHTGGTAWVASGLAVIVPPGGAMLRVVGDLALTAGQSRTLKLELPALGLVFGSGRTGPVDTGWSSLTSTVIDVVPTLHVRSYAVQSPTQSVPRRARRLPVLGIELQAQAVLPDTLEALRLAHTSVGPAGPASDPDAQIEAAELWLDRDGDGAVDAAGLGDDDILLAQLGAPVGGTLAFGQPAPLALQLPPAQPVRLLVTLTPDSTRVRDAEQLSVRLGAASDLQIPGPIAIDLSAPLSTTDPPVIDGQDVAGYAVRPVGTSLVYAGTREWPVLDLALPANGLEDDVLEGLRIENSGTATSGDIAAIRLRRDDGDGVPEDADALVAELAPAAAQAWEASALGAPLAAGAPARYWITIDLAPNPQSGATFSAQLPRNGVSVRSGNDGPYDFAAAGGGPAVVAVADRVTWVGGVAGTHQVPPNAQARAVLVLEGFNGYLEPRTLTSLQVSAQGSAAASEYAAWGLHHDANRNGVLDRAETDAPLAIAAVNGGTVRFEGFEHALPALQQDRLFVTYSLAFGTARDGSTIDAVVPGASSFTYKDDGGSPTTSVGDFNLDSPGQDTVDGMIAAQVPGFGVPSRTIGAGEANVLVLNRRLPANGWEADTLEQLTVELVDFGPGQSALMGSDIEALRLWAESDPQGVAAFDPAQDLLIASLVGAQSPLSFTGLAAPIPVGGRRFYVTADVGPGPGDGHKLRLRVPVDGITMASGNDGPIDLELLGSATHRISASTLLVEVDGRPDVVSQGQTVTVRIAVHNQGSQPLSGVQPFLMQPTPATGVVLVSGPQPPTLDLAAGAVDTLTYQFTLQQVGEVVFATEVGTADSAVVSGLAASAPVHVQSLPVGLVLEPFSSLPVSVNRGQDGVTPMAWRLAQAEPDTNDGAAISVQALRVGFDDGAGVAIPASAVIDQLTIRTGSLIHAAWDSIPAQSALTIGLDPPIVLAPGEARSLPLEVSIAPTAAAGRFRLLLQAAAATAIDVNSGAAVAVQAPDPWHTSTAYIRTLATRVDVGFAATMPRTANAGQAGVPAGRLTFALPGAAGESEARVVELAVSVRDTAAVPLDPADVLTALRVRSGGAVLAAVTAFDTTSGLLHVPLAIPKLLTSGVVDALDLEVDLRPTPAVDRFSIAFPDASCLVVQDANTGSDVPAFATTPPAFPFEQGPLAIQRPAQGVRVEASSACPAAVAAGAVSVPIANLIARDEDAPGCGDVEVWALTLRVLDETGSGIAPGQALTSLRLTLGDTVLARDDAPASSGSTVDLLLPIPLRLAPGSALSLALTGDLESPSPASRLRFALDLGAIAARDANEPSRALAVTGLPFATDLMRVVAPPTAVAVGPTADPPVNVLRGTMSAAVLPLRLAHPGAEGEAPLDPQRLVLALRGRDVRPLAVAAIATAARLRAGQIVLAGSIAADSVDFDLAPLPDLDQGSHVDLVLELDVAPEPGADDFRIALDAEGMSALAGDDRLPVQALGGASLPYLSPTVHLAQPTMAGSFSSYPNPFAAGRDQAHVVFYLPAQARVTLDVYTVTGERVRRLLDGEVLPAGLHDDPRWGWDGRNGAGDVVRNGAYLLRLAVDGPQGGELIRKVAVVR